MVELVEVLDEFTLVDADLTLEMRAIAESGLLERAVIFVWMVM
jgi:hypothetical protein